MLEPHSRSLRIFTQALCLSSAVGLAILEARIWSTNTRHLFYTPFNLLLAWVPLGLATLAERQLRTGEASRWVGWMSLTAWLFFFPNAPYLITDLVYHFNGPSPYAWQSDLAVLAIFSLTGVTLGLGSLRIVHRVVEARAGALAGWLTVGASSILCGFGIYIGHFLRWNSWDLLLHPIALLADVLQRLSHAATEPYLLTVTLDFAQLMAGLYFVIYFFLNKTSRPASQDA